MSQVITNGAVYHRTRTMTLDRAARFARSLSQALGTAARLQLVPRNVC